MPTTIQISERTLEILKKVKSETDSSSYDEAINKMAAPKQRESMAGYLGRMPLKEIMKGLRDEKDRI